MGLAERRAIDEYKKGEFETHKKAITALTGSGVTLDVEWDKLAAEGQVHLYHESFGPLYFIPLIEALTSIARDDMGKEALAAGLKSILITCTSNYWTPSNFTFKDGKLVIDHSISNVSEVKERTTAIIDLLEKGL